MRLALFQPDIPQNFGAAIRLCACFAVPLDLIEPAGFALTDKAIKRAAMDYGGHVAIRRHDGWTHFREWSHAQGRRLVLLTTESETLLPDFSFTPADTLILGRESAGATPELRQNAAALIRIPMAPAARSLNVVNAGAIALYEALRQTGALTACALRPNAASIGA